MGGTSERTTVTIAFATGWHMAELYHSPVPTTIGAPARGYLVGISKLTVAQRFALHLAQVEVGVTGLLPGDPLLQRLSELAARPPVPDDDRGAVSGRIANLHEDLLVRLCAVDATSGKAYGLGRALAETVLLPRLAEIPAQDDAKLPDPDTVYKAQFDPDRLANLYGWLADLKSLLPDHSAYAVSWSLQQWAQWVNGTAHPTAEKSARARLRRQGEQWRALLSAERQGKDLLTALDYVDAAKGLSAGLGRAIGAFVSRYRGTVVLGATAILGVLGGLVAAAVMTDDLTYLWGGVTALLGAAGGWRGLSGTLGKGLRTVEPFLWESELDRAIADQIVLLPDTAVQTSQPPDSIGLLKADKSNHVKEWRKTPTTLPPTQGQTSTPPADGGGTVTPDG